MPARLKSPPPETVAYVRSRYAARAPVAGIRRETGLSLGAIYQCLDGAYDDGSGGPIPALPRRSIIAHRRRPLAHVRDNVTSQLWRIADRQADRLDQQLRRADLTADEWEANVRMFGVVSHCVCELLRSGKDDGAVAPPFQSKEVAISGDDDPVPRDIDEFRRRLADKIDRLAAAAAVGGSEGTSG